MQSTVAQDRTETASGLVQQMPTSTASQALLTPAAQVFLEAMHRRFASRVVGLLAARGDRQARLDAGEGFELLRPQAGDWRVAAIPAELRDRRVEITGPPERKMVVNALNSGARVFMADFEDSLTPTWNNLLDGQLNLRDAVARRIDFSSETGKRYALNAQTAVLMVRPRGWHLYEKHITVDGAPLPGAVFDFGLFLFHNAQTLLQQGSGPYFYLPKLEGHSEARLWAEVFAFAEEWLALPHGAIKATVLIETLPAAFEMDAILFALRDYIIGLNCGRWDYIFSYIKKLNCHSRFMLPERGQVGMTVPFLRSYSQLLIQTCHRRGAFAMGGMAAQIPIRGDAAANAAALDKVRADKQREAGDGHDGTWVAHPALVPVAMEIFNARLAGPNQLTVLRNDVAVTAADLLAVPQGSITRAGFRNNVTAALGYLAAWLGGNGCVPLNHLMEDAATAEIARAQLWQWIRHAGHLDDDTPITFSLFASALDAELDQLRLIHGAAHLESHYYNDAAQLLHDITAQEAFADFLTLPAYEAIIRRGE